MRGLKKEFLVFAFSVFLVILIWTPVGNADYLDPFNYQDTRTFNSEVVHYESFSWLHSIPTDFTPVSAGISLTLKILNYSESGVLDLFCSNTTTFDYGNIWVAPSKPGFIADLYAAKVPINNWKTVSFPLKTNQLDWLADDGNIYLALIGPQYSTPGFSAQFQVQSASLTATGSVVPLPGPVWLLGSGLLGLGLLGWGRNKG
jgi:hypothetical protein